MTSDLYLICSCEKLQKIRSYEISSDFRWQLNCFKHFLRLCFHFSCKPRDIVFVLYNLCIHKAYSFFFVTDSSWKKKSEDTNSDSKNFWTAGSDGKWFFDSSIPFPRTFIAGTWTLVLQADINDGKTVLLIYFPYNSQTKKKIINKLGKQNHSSIIFVLNVHYFCFNSFFGRVGVGGVGGGGGEETKKLLLFFCLALFMVWLGV